MRIGQGFDVHAFSADPDRRLVLGGVEIPESPGLIGHSDADVATHALMDALLGAAGLGDLGRHFPDSDPSYAGADSIALLREVIRLVAEAGLAPCSGDVTLVAQSPRLAPYLDAMATTLSEATQTNVSIKATTTEHLGALGRSEGIGALAVVLVEER